MTSFLSRGVRSGSPSSCFFISVRSRLYFTNGKETKKTDPYAILGLQWGEGATTSEIKAAYKKAAYKLHPDVNSADSPAEALKKFQQLQKAYDTLMKSVTGNVNNMDMNDWQDAIWRRGDRIAMDRTDVAGVKKRRPVPSAKSKVYSRELGHPQGAPASQGEYLGTKEKKSSSVGSGQSKWVRKKEFRPWDENDSKSKKAS
jgi:hypothetical protein